MFVNRFTPNQRFTPQRMQSPSKRIQPMFRPSAPRIQPAEIHEYRYMNPIIYKSEVNVCQIIETHHIDRPIEMVTIETIEEPFRERALELERLYVELTLQLQEQNLRDKSHRRSTFYQSPNILVSQLEKEIEELETELIEKDQEFHDLNEELQELEIQSETIETQDQQQNDEVNVWKKKFQEINRLYHDNEEEFMMKEAELDALKNKVVKETREIHLKINKS